MSLKEYLNQKEPQRMPAVLIKPNEYKVSSTIKTGNEVRKSVYFKTKNPLLAGVEYCLIGTRFYTTDRDGNPLSRTCFITT